MFPVFFVSAGLLAVTARSGISVVSSWRSRSQHVLLIFSLEGIGKRRGRKAIELRKSKPAARWQQP